MTTVFPTNYLLSQLPFSQTQTISTRPPLQLQMPPTYPRGTKMGDLDFKLNHQIKSKNIFNCDMFTRELENIIYDYYYEIILSIRQHLLEEMTDNHEEITDNHEEMTDYHEEMTDNHEEKRKKIGGELNLDCVTMLLWCLNYGIPDSLHDFGKSRNGIFPQFSKTKNRASDFLKIAEQFLNKNYSNFGQISQVDKLYNYYSNNPTNFEDIVKDDFLLGNICGDVDNMYYYFSESFPSTWETKKIQFFEKNPPNQMNPFFEKLRNDGYEYCILDACMSIQTESQWQDKITLVKSLCNLWDPAGAGKITFKELADGNNSKYKLSLVYENEVMVNGKMHYIYDSRTTVGDKSISMYDYVYNNLLNLYCIPKITFKLRIASATDIRTTESVSSEFYPAVSITQDGLTTTYIPIPLGGFSVQVLSYGLYFIETGDDYIIPVKQSAEYANLKEIIIVVYKMLITTMDPINTKQYLYILLTRFKSTGDHGSAMTTEFFNEILKLNTLYLSGDRLAYIYSIAKNIPTVARYYAASSSSSMEVEEESEESCDRVHFLGVLLPQKDPVISAKNKLAEILVFLDSLPKSSLSPINRISSIADIYNDINQVNDILKEKISDQYVDTLDNTTIFTTIIQPNVTILVPQLTNLLSIIDSTNINTIKSLLTILKQYHDNVYYIYKYPEIQADIKQTINSQISELQKVIDVNAYEIITGAAIVANARQSRSSTASFRPVTWLQTIFKQNKNIHDSIDLINALQITQDTDANSYYDKILAIKKKFYAKITDLSLSMKEKYGNSAPFVLDKSKQIMNKYNRNIKTILEKDNSVIGKTILTMFGFISEAIVPIKSDDITTSDVFTSPTRKKLSVANVKEKIDKITNAASSIVNYLNPLKRRRGGSRKNKKGTKHRVQIVKKKQTKKAHGKNKTKKRIIS